jgi:hypothetical protein
VIELPAPPVKYLVKLNCGHIQPGAHPPWEEGPTLDWFFWCSTCEQTRTALDIVTSKPLPRPDLLEAIVVEEELQDA